MLLVPDLYKDKKDTIKSIKYITFNKNGKEVRLDRIDLKLENNNKILERMTHFGNYYGNFIDINDFIYSKTDINSKEVVSMETSVTNAVFGYSHIPTPNNFIGIDGETENFPFINKSIYGIDKLNGYIPRKAEIRDNVALPDVAYQFEDLMNLGYSDIVGNLSAILTQTALSVPFRANIIFDSKYGVKVDKINLLFKDYELKELLNIEMKSLMNAINVIQRSVKEKYEKNKREIRIYAAIREFDTYITFKDIQMNTDMYFHLNNSDHARTLYSTMAHLGPRWFDTDEFGELVETKCKTVASAMYGLESEDRRYTFENTDYSDNFPMSYN